MLRNVIWHGMLGGFRLMGSPLGTAVALLGKSEHWSRERLDDWQRHRVNEVMEHCYRYVPYYRRVMKERGLTPDDFKAVEDLGKMPILTKDIVRAEGRNLWAEGFQDRVTHVRRSGGTTAEPIPVAIDRTVRAWDLATAMRGFRWMGYRTGRPHVKLFGGSLGSEQPSMRGRVRDWVRNVHSLPAFDLRPENVGDYHRAVCKARGGILRGYASAIYNFAECVAREKLGPVPLASAICTAEQLPNEWRKRISEVLGVPVYAYYGCGEINSLGHMHSDHQGYIIPEEHVVLEAVSETESYGGTGRGLACVTTLTNFVMPMIRYVNGDELELGYLEDGIAHKRILQLHGRIFSYLHSVDGHRVSGMLSTHMVFRAALPVWKWQLVQRRPDCIEFHYLPSEGSQFDHAAGERVTRIVRDALGDTMHVECIEGKFDIPASGKHVLVVNRLESNELQSREVCNLPA